MTVVVVPGGNNLPTPISFNAFISSSGIMPPPVSNTSFIFFSFIKLIILGKTVLCAPLKILTPIASTSSCNAAFTTISGVCLNPV